jgi:hypothetical protein
MPGQPKFFSSKPMMVGLICWFVLLIANGWIIAHKDDGYGYRRLATYDELYVPAEKQFVKRLQFKNDTAVIEFSHPIPSAQWKFFRDDSVAGAALVKQHLLLLPLEQGIHRYRFEELGINQPAFSCAIDFVCYNEMQQPGCRNEWLYGSLPMPEKMPASLAMWWDQSSFSDKELVAGRNQLFSGQPSSFTDSLKNVFSYLHQMNRSDTGVRMPDSLVCQYSPVSWLLASINNRYRMDCGEFTWISHFMFNAMRLPNRAVKLSATNADWHTGEHYAIEVYLPWKQQWGLVDGLLDLYLPQDSSGNLLNAADIQQLMLSGSRLPDLQGWAVDSLNWQLRSLQTWYGKLKVYYSNPRSFLNYLDMSLPMESNDVAGKLKRYATMYSSNAILSNRIKNDYFKIGVKLFTFYSFLLLSLGLLITWFGRRRKI